MVTIKATIVTICHGESPGAFLGWLREYGSMLTPETEGYRWVNSGFCSTLPLFYLSTHCIGISRNSANLLRICVFATYSGCIHCWSKSVSRTTLDKKLNLFENYYKLNCS